jgi:hypothetical protein
MTDVNAKKERNSGYAESRCRWRGERTLAGRRLAIGKRLLPQYELRERKLYGEAQL